MSCYGNNELAFSSVTRWYKKFQSGVDSVKLRRPKTATLPKMVEKVKDLIAFDASFIINAGAAHTILRRDLKMRRINARGIPPSYKIAILCSDKNLETIVETVLLMQQSILCKNDHWR
jgi:hypothetical protein